MKYRNKKIIFSGGGTGGSVTPLLAVAKKYAETDSDTALVFIGTESGPEKEMVAASDLGMRFVSILSGKWRRYISLWNFLDIFKIMFAFVQSIFILMSEKPSLIVSAGGFVSVPLVWAAGLLRIPILIHQQDVRPGLANKLMAPQAKVITTTFEKSVTDYGKKAVWIGNPIIDLDVYRNNVDRTKEKYRLRKDVSIVLVVGGGTGAQGINDLVFSGIEDLTKSKQIVHLTGKGKFNKIKKNNYQAFDFLPHKEVLALVASADLVISRCGLGFLTELSALAKAAIIIPIPNSHQEDNAALFKEYKAALVLDQNKLTGKSLSLYADRLLGDKELLLKLRHNISKPIKAGASEKMVNIMREIMK